MAGDDLVNLLFWSSVRPTVLRMPPCPCRPCQPDPPSWADAAAPQSIVDITARTTRPLLSLITFLLSSGMKLDVERP
jgi:hypothetical protein